MRFIHQFLTAVSLLAVWAPASAETTRPTLALVNKSGQSINELYISSTRNTDWGGDRLGNGTIDKNATFRLRLTEGCLYDLQVVYADKRTEERMRVNLCRTPTQTFTAAEAHAIPTVPSHQFTLENHSTQPIAALAVADPSGRPGAEDWGDNLLPSPLPPGGRATVSYEGACLMAVRVLFDNGSAEQRHPAELCTDAEALTVQPGWTTGGDAAPAEIAAPVTVTNRSSHRVVELFLDPDDTPRGDERLGTRVLDPGAAVQLALQRDGKCRFTVRSVFEGHVPDEVTPGIDFCPRRAVDVGAPGP